MNNIISDKTIGDVDIIKQSFGDKMSIMYINGLNVSIICGISEIDIQRRKGWIERKLRKSGDFSHDNIASCIKMSRFWLNYVTLGARYPTAVNASTYLEWDKDRIGLPNYKNLKSQKSPKSQQQLKRSNTKGSSNRNHNYNHKK